MEYATTVLSTTQPEFSQPDSGLVVPVFQKGDDPIDAINHMMSEDKLLMLLEQQENTHLEQWKATTGNNGLYFVYNAKGRVKLPSSVLAQEKKGMKHGLMIKGFLDSKPSDCHYPQCISKPMILDAYDSDCDELNSAKIVSCESFQEWLRCITETETDINRDSNIIPYSQYPSETQTEYCTRIHNSSAQQDVLILSMFEQLNTQVMHCTNVNLEYKSANKALTTKLDRYKEEVKDLKENQNSQAKDTVIVKLKEQIKSLKGNVDDSKVKMDMDEIETLNIELEHRVTKLVLRYEHLRQTLYANLRTRLNKRITTTNEVPSRKPIVLESESPKPVVNLVYSRKLRKNKNTESVSKTMSANKQEPRKSWGSTKTNIPSTSLMNACCSKFVPLVFWTTVARRHLTKNALSSPFISKFLGTVKFGNDQVTKIMVMETIRLGILLFKGFITLKDLGIIYFLWDNSVIPISSGFSSTHMLHSQSRRKLDLSEILPCVEEVQMDEDKEGKAIDPSHYHGMIGTLLYLTATKDFYNWNERCEATFESAYAEKGSIEKPLERKRLLEELGKDSIGGR
ncbi:hypothetical protein Tco_0923351 [Tanacetum coccineum]|uniref:Uncharacterized protein n=1 Tax=Tanacetum coccineum TaxID=301880 RepID=A0ABQ5D2B2_9ASTR